LARRRRPERAWAPQSALHDAFKIALVEDSDDG